MIKLHNILFAHDTINNNTPPVIFKDYFIFNEVSHQHDTINDLASTYSVPNDLLQVHDYRTNLGKSLIKYICSSIGNKFLKDLSMKNIEKNHQDPFWISKTNVKILKSILWKYFSKIIEHI